MGIYSCDSPEESKLCYTTGPTSNNFCVKCFAKKKDVTNCCFSDFELKTANFIKEEYLKVKNDLKITSTSLGFSFYKKDKLKPYNSFWDLIEIGIDINQIISPDLFHSLFSCLTETLHIIITDELSTNEKNLCKKNMESIIMIQKFDKLKFSETGLYDIDDWLIYSLLIEFIFNNVLDIEKSLMINYFSTCCFLLIRKKLTKEIIERAEYCYRNFMILLLKLYDTSKWEKKSSIHKCLHFFKFFQENGPGKLTWAKHFECFHVFFKKRLRLSNYTNCSKFLAEKYLEFNIFNLYYPNEKNENFIYLNDDITYKTNYFIDNDEEDFEYLNNCFDFENVILIDEVVISHKKLKSGNNIAYYCGELYYGRIEKIFLLNDEIVFKILKYNLTPNGFNNFINFEFTILFQYVNIINVLGEIFCFNKKLNIQWIE
jgi:hypothetical protein